MRRITPIGVGRPVAAPELVIDGAGAGIAGAGAIRPSTRSSSGSPHGASGWPTSSPAGRASAARADPPGRARGLARLRASSAGGERRMVPTRATHSAAADAAAGVSLGAILDCIALPVWVVDHDGVVVLANPAAVEALGY